MTPSAEVTMSSLYLLRGAPMILSGIAGLAIAAWMERNVSRPTKMEVGALRFVSWLYWTTAFVLG